TRLNLASLAGEIVSFRWRMGLDQFTYVWGWWLDDVKIYQCVPADTTPPTVASIVRAGANPTSAASIDFTVTFSELVTGVNADAFALDMTGNVAGANITDVTGSGSTWTVVVDTGSGDGTLGLRVPIGADIKDAAGNSLGSLPFTDSEQYTIDKTAPTVTSIVRASANPTSADSVDFTVTFSEDVTDVDTVAPFNDFTLTTTGVTGAAITSVSGSDLIWTVTVNTGSGDGKLGLDLAVASGITDLVGNPLEQGPFTPDEEYTIDKTHAFLVAPVNGEPLLYRRPTFDWSDVPGASGYRITASKSSSFSTLLWEVDTTDSTYTPSADLPGGQVIYWRVSAQVNDIWGAWSERWSFTTGNPPSIPGLASPANASLTRDYTPLLDWNNSTMPSGAAAFDHYEVQVATDTLFIDPVLIDEGTPTGQITASSYTPTANLAANTTYFWRVRSYNVSGQYSSWSTVRSFRTALLPPSDLTPDGGMTVSSRKPVLDWDTVDGAEGYSIQISTSSSFGSLLVNTSTTTNTFTPSTNLPAHKTIYWRVRTTGANGPSGWTTASFKTP
ncbi:MAG TPA: Ig-like domain-containing protein, partial [Anaerolineales bacterium]|nr:Ig-like domain-containing protein [Anaerolineales bacterium]